MRTMKGKIKRNSNGWLIVNSLSNLSTRIRIRFIEQIEITANEIKIHTKKEWTVIRRYNQDTIEAHLRETQKRWKDIYCMNDLYFGEGTEERQVREAQENQRCYLEGLSGIREVGISWETICKKALSTGMSWLRDKDFNRLKQQLESLSNKFALNIKDED